eukprot:11391160-Karenia_brevis.AAC.1
MEDALEMGCGGRCFKGICVCRNTYCYGLFWLTHRPPTHPSACAAVLFTCRLVGTFVWPCTLQLASPPV